MLKNGEYSKINEKIQKKCNTNFIFVDIQYLQPLAFVK